MCYWQQAASTFERIIETDPLNFNARFYLGFSSLMLKEYLKAIEEFTWVIEQDTECCDAYFKRAICHRVLGNSAAAFNDVKSGKECEEQNNER